MASEKYYQYLSDMVTVAIVSINNFKGIFQNSRMIINGSLIKPYKRNICHLYLQLQCYKVDINDNQKGFSSFDLRLFSHILLSLITYFHFKTVLLFRDTFLASHTLFTDMNVPFFKIQLFYQDLIIY